MYIVNATASHPRGHLLSRLGVACWVLAMWVRGLPCPRVNVACAAANRVTIAATGGVEVIVQGMHAHVGVVAVQELGAWAFCRLGSNGALFHL